MVASNLFDLPQAIILSNQTEQSWSDSLFEFLNLPKYSKPCFSTFYDQIHADDLEGVQNIYRHLDHWYNGRSKQLTFRIKCPINGYKWITNIMQSQVFPDKQLIITSRFFDANVVKRGSMSLHQIQQQLERADPLSADPDIQYNPDLVDKVTQFTRIGWFEYYIPDSRTVYSSSIKPMVGLDDQDRFTAEYFKSIVEADRVRLPLGCRVLVNTTALALWQDKQQQSMPKRLDKRKSARTATRPRPLDKRPVSLMTWFPAL